MLSLIFYLLQPRLDEVMVFEVDVMSSLGQRAGLASIASVEVVFGPSWATMRVPWEPPLEIRYWKDFNRVEAEWLGTTALTGAPACEQVVLDSLSGLLFTDTRIKIALISRDWPIKSEASVGNQLIVRDASYTVRTFIERDDSLLGWKRMTLVRDDAAGGVLFAAVSRTSRLETRSAPTPDFNVRTLRYWDVVSRTREGR